MWIKTWKTDGAEVEITTSEAVLMLNRHNSNVKALMKELKANPGQCAHLSATSYIEWRE